MTLNFMGSNIDVRGRQPANVVAYTVGSEAREPMLEVISFLFSMPVLGELLISSLHPCS